MRAAPRVPAAACHVARYTPSTVSAPIVLCAANLRLALALDMPVLSALRVVATGKATRQALDIASYALPAGGVRRSSSSSPRTA